MTAAKLLNTYAARGSGRIITRYFVHTLSMHGAHVCFMEEKLPCETTVNTLCRSEVLPLPRVTCIVTVYLEDLDTIVNRTLSSISAAMDFYKSQGGSGNVVVADDGMRSGRLTEHQVELRKQACLVCNPRCVAIFQDVLQVLRCSSLSLSLFSFVFFSFVIVCCFTFTSFHVPCSFSRGATRAVALGLYREAYSELNCSWCARPLHGRQGRFKTAGNRNYAVAICELLGGTVHVKVARQRLELLADELGFALYDGEGLVELYERYLLGEVIFISDGESHIPPEGFVSCCASFRNEPRSVTEVPRCWALVANSQVKHVLIPRSTPIRQAGRNWRPNAASETQCWPLLSSKKQS